MNTNIKQLKHICSLTQHEVKNYCIDRLKNMGYDVQVADGYVYAQGKYPVMLAAHLDTVHEIHSDHSKSTSTFSKVNDTNVPLIRQVQTQVIDAKGLLSSPQGIGGDDRCGVYIIFEILKTYACSVLFCEEEEVGGIGAKKFCDSGIVPEVNYFMEFDRRGITDAVFYSCGTKSFIEFITAEKHFSKAFGSFSDISVLMPHFKIAGVNLSSGYEGAHTKVEVINTIALPDIIFRAKAILEKESGKFIYEANFVSGYSYYDKSTRKWDAYDDYDDSDYESYSGYAGRKKQKNYSWRDSSFNVGYLPTFSDLSADVEETTAIKFEIKYYDQTRQCVHVRAFWAKHVFAALGRFMTSERHICYEDVLDIIPYPNIYSQKTPKNNTETKTADKTLEEEIKTVVQETLALEDKKGDVTSND